MKRFKGEAGLKFLYSSKRFLSNRLALNLYIEKAVIEPFSSPKL